MSENGPTSRDHRECPHSWASWFGPVLKCSKCGAETITSAAPGESKPIFPPRKALEDTEPTSDCRATLAIPDVRGASSGA